MLRKKFKQPSLFGILIISLVLLVTLIFTPIAQAQVLEDAAAYDVYKYPVLPGTDAWKAFNTYDEMIAACQVPDDLLKNMPTKGLVETVLNHPLIKCSRIFNDLQQGFEETISRFNSVSELFNRRDAGSVLLSYYCTFDPPTFKEGWTDIQKIDYIYSIQDIELLLSQDAILETLTAVQRQELIAVAENKNQIMQENQFIHGNYDDRVISLLIEKVSGRQYSERATMVPIETPNHTIIYAWAMVPIVKPYGDELTTVEKNALTYYQQLFFPNVSVLRLPTAMYNCHSYAWYNQSVGNQIAIDSGDQYAYWLDGSYDPYTGTPYAGLKINYASDDHSAIVHSYSGGILKYKSKWGQAGLYIHDPGYCPYVSSDIDYYQ
jgi:hypothetical protein